MPTAPPDATPGKTSSSREFFGHPYGLSTLFFTEMWERFSYYGMRALLILFMTASVEDGGLGFDVVKAGAIYGLYTAMVYIMSVPGGWLADQILGQRKCILYGGIVIALGHFSMAFPSMATFYAGLVLIIAGTGLLKPNVSALVGELYSAEDPRRDAGYSLYYMGINVGAFSAPLACGYLGQQIDWHLGFGLAGVGMTLGLVQYVVGGKHLGTAGLHPAPARDEAAARRRTQILYWSITGTVAVAAGVAILSAMGALEITAEGLSDFFGGVLLLTTAIVFGLIFLAGNWTREERKKLVVVVVLFVAASLFWASFEQAGSTLNLFAQRDTNNLILGFEIPSSWYLSLNALFIITLAPIFAWLWVSLRHRQPSTPAKFAFGLLLVGAGFLILAWGAALAAGGAKVGPQWLLFTYLLHTMGELCLSPVGLSAMTKLAPRQIVGSIMGVWFLATSVGNFISGRMAGFYEAMELDQLFGSIGISLGLFPGLLLLLLVIPIKRLMAGVK